MEHHSRSSLSRNEPWGIGDANGPLSSRPFRGDLRNLKAHKLGTNRCIQGVPDISRLPPPTGSPTALWQNYCRETHLQTSHPYLDGCCLC